MAGRRGNNEGLIRKRVDGRWEARISLPDGKSKAFYAKTRAEVAKKLTDALHAAEQGIAPANEKQTLAQYLRSWLEVKRPPRLAESTWISYQGFVELHIVPSLGNVRIAKLTPQHVQALYAAKLQEGLSPTTVNHLHACLRTALKAAVRLDLVPRNVCDLVDAPRMAHHEMRVLMAEQARTLLAAVQGNRMEAFYVLALTTGMRLGELLGLRWSDVIDLEGPRPAVEVRMSLNRRGKGWNLKEAKTKRSRRRIALTASTADALRRHRIRQHEEQLKLGAAWQNTSGLVFTSTVGTPLVASNVRYQQFLPLLKRAGLPQIRIHDLRHTAATLLLRANVNPKVVSELLGHASIAITLDIYSHVLPDMQQDATAAMERMLLAEG